MSPLLPGLSAELAQAIREVNAAFCRLPDNRRPALAPEWIALEDKIEAACARGDQTVAGAAIEAWRDHCLELIEGCQQS
jgi:hypothetical protein